jgi:hypothetical protein
MRSGYVASIQKSKVTYGIRKPLEQCMQKYIYLKNYL